jgi:hypothetical protein
MDAGMPAASEPRPQASEWCILGGSNGHLGAPCKQEHLDHSAFALGSLVANN